MRFLKNKLTVAVMILSVGFLILIGYSIKRDSRSILEGGAGAALIEVEKHIYGFGEKFKDFMYLILNFSEVKEEYESMGKRNAELEGKAIQFDSLKAENERLRNMLDFKDRNSFYHYIPSHIISRVGQGILESYKIDRGSNEGVVKGMVVISSEGLVGQVTSVTPYWSMVQTLGNENIAVGAMVLNTKESNGIVKGYKDRNNRLLAKIYSLPQDSTVKPGDIITTSGEGFIYPKGVQIGKVISVEEDKAKVMKNALIEPFVDFNKLEEIMIIVPKDKSIMKYQGEEIK